MADFFAPKRPSGRVAPEPGLGSIPENRDAPATLPRPKDDQLQSKEHVAEAVDAFIKAKSFRPALARADRVLEQRQAGPRRGVRRVAPVRQDDVDLAHDGVLVLRFVGPVHRCGRVAFRACKAWVLSRKRATDASPSLAAASGNSAAPCVQGSETASESARGYTDAFLAR